RVDLLPLFDAVVEFGKHVACARRGLGLALDLHAIAPRRDIDAKAVFDRDEIAVELAKENAQQLRSLEFRGQPNAVAGFGRRSCERTFGHQASCNWRTAAPRLF